MSERGDKQPPRDAGPDPAGDAVAAAPATGEALAAGTDEAPSLKLAAEADDNPFVSIPETLDTLGAPSGRVLVLDPDPSAAAVVREILAGDGHRVEACASLETGLAQASRRGGPDVLLLDPFAEGWGGLALLDRLPTGRAEPTPEVILLSRRDDAETAVTALHRGATDYVTKPLSSDRLRLAVVRAIEKRRLAEENTRLKRDLALSGAGQRLLETLDLNQLAERGIDVMCSFTGAAAALLRGQDGILAHRGMAPDEVAAIGRLRSTRLAELQFIPQALDAQLARFDDGLSIDLGEHRRLVLLRIGAGFSHHAEEDALFLGRHLASAYKNAVRFTTADRRARRDPLTGLLNARAFEEAVHHQVLRSQVHGRPFAVVFLDLDHFKQVNDQHGHLDGSRLLVELSRVLVRTLREGAMVSRFGGDEFVILLPGLDSYAARRVAERLRTTIQDHAFLTREGRNLSLTICLGIASYPETATSAQALLDMADKAMYLGKSASRNAVHVAATADPAAEGGG